MSDEMTFYCTKRAHGAKTAKYTAKDKERTAVKRSHFRPVSFHSYVDLVFIFYEEDCVATRKVYRPHGLLCQGLWF